MPRLWEPLGGWRSGLLIRLFGYCIVTSSLIDYAGIPVDQMWAHGEPIHLLTAVLGVALLVAGARLLLLLVVTATLGASFGLVLSDASFFYHFPAAEWTLLLGLPAGCAAVAVAALTRQTLRATEPDLQAYHREIDWGIAWVFRIGALTTLGFAGLHKLNSDFLDPEVSCVSLKERLHAWWGLPTGLTAWVSPEFIIGIELLLPLVLAWRPRLGIPLAIALVAEFGSIGAPAFASLVMVMSFAFVPDSAREPLLRGLREHRWGIVACLGALWLVEARFFHGDYPLLPVSFAQSLAVLGLWCGGLLLAAGADGAPHASAAPTGRTRTGQGVLAGLLVLALFNGLTPYLGTKFQFSFAMLSNLRVDDTRWNSLLFPRSVRLTAHDPYLHITQTHYADPEGNPIPFEKGPLDPGLYLPRYALHVVMEWLPRGVMTTFDFAYRGRSYRFIGAPDPRKLYRMLTALPHEPLFQNALKPGKQTCTH